MSDKLVNPRPSTGAASAASTCAPRPSIGTTGRPSDMTVPLVTTSLTHSSVGASIERTPNNLAPAEVVRSFMQEHAALGLPPGSFGERLAGLTEEQAQRKLVEFGRNEIPEVVEQWYIMLGKQFVGLMPFMLEIAAVLSVVNEDWADLIIIMLMLVVNGLIGFHEEHKAKQSLDALRAEMTATVPVKRDGAMVIKPVAELVPGDIVFLRGGNIVPADCEWLEGDEMLVDTAALTGEPIPRKVPNPQDDTAAGRKLLSGCIIKQGEGHCEVLSTGLETEIGQAAGLVQEASGHQMGYFETRIMQVVKAVILLTLIDAVVVLFFDKYARDMAWKDALIRTLALVIGAVPIALPLVMQVTMAIGAAKMAKRKAIVTHLTALQEIASMTVLCSDKTGTLTTAQMAVKPDKIWTRNGYTKEDALVWAGVASNPANAEDPIDKAVLMSVREQKKQGVPLEGLMDQYRKLKFVGFNPTVKRTVVYCEHPGRGKIKISKGLVDKVLVTGDDGGDMWECVDAEALRPQIKEVDAQFANAGYKTVGVSVAEKEGPMQFAAIVPMSDPPRADTKLTIHRIQQGGISVKMITGDHRNIAIETCRLIGLGMGILPATDLWPASYSRDEMIMEADGFAQVLPKDKREVVLVLQNRGLVVGMTGDGVNDSPALAQAQIGIAVDGATEAARSAADIILTEPGLSAIFDAVVESRKIFARLRAYVLYRIAATIQIVLVLSILIYAFNEPLPALYVILLALLNDVTMLPIADDNAVASALPEIPTIFAILQASCIYGIMESALTMGFYLSGWCKGDDTDKYRTAVVYLQISIAIELLIFSCRTPGFVLLAVRGEKRPSCALFMSVMGANVLVSLLAGFGSVFDNKIIYNVSWADIGIIWAYDIVGLIVIDLVKSVLGWARVGWMAGGAAGGVLEYPDLPEEALSSHGGSQAMRSTVVERLSHHQSVMLGRRASRSPASLRGAPSHAPRSASTLPYPYNLRADLFNWKSIG